MTQPAHWTDEIHGRRDPALLERIASKKEADPEGCQSWPGVMQNRREVELIFRVFEDVRPGTYMELGCGPGCVVLRELVKRCDWKCRFEGFEHVPQKVTDPQVIYYQCDILKEDGRGPEQIIDSLKTAIRPALIYCDNGRKMQELELVTRHMKKGDVVGCHDYGFEVFPQKLQFMADRGMVVLDEYEGYITQNICSQRFWRKQS